MTFSRQWRALPVPASPLTTGLLIALLAFALLPISAAAHMPGGASPNSVTAFPTAQAPSGVTAGQTTLRTGKQQGAKATLGSPVIVSLELRAGTRIGFTFNAAGQRTSSRSVSLAAAEADSATRRFRKSGSTYYLLDWGSLTGYWVRVAPGVRVIPTATWNVLVMVYRQTNLQFADASGVNRHLGATMSAESEALMVGAVRTMPTLAREWSSGVVSQKMTVVYPTTPLSSLTPLGEGAYWLAPADIAADLDLHAPPRSYDSIMVIWQPWDAEDYIASWGWGLAFPAGPSSNDSAYATVTVPPRGSSAWITSMPYPGEPFMHEWLHGVIDYHAAKGSDTPALHDDAEYGYTEEGGTWARWYRDLMQHHVRDPRSGATVGISYLDWRSGTPTATQ